MKETKLLNCPFCDGDAVTAEMYNIKLKKLFPIVKCLDCECRTRMTETFEEAITAWNTRKPMERIIEQLENASFTKNLGNNMELVILKDRAIEIINEGGGIE